MVGKRILVKREMQNVSKSLTKFYNRSGTLAINLGKEEYFLCLPSYLMDVSVIVDTSMLVMVQSWSAGQLWISNREIKF